MPLLVDQLDVTLGTSPILHGISLTVEQGESVALLGANGSGKSTLVKTCLGIVPSTRGRIEIYGKDLARKSSVPWRKIGYVPQRVGASSGVPATALEVVRSGLLSRSTPWKDRGRQAHQAAMEALAAVDLADRAHDHVQVFSGGQAQRVLIARALVRNPSLLFLDEPLAGIDRTSRETLATILSSLRERGLTLITVLHEMGELTPIVERAVVLEEGRIIHDGEPPATDHPHHHPGETGCEHLHPHDSLSRVAHHAPVLRNPA
nr:ATP-binding cassette domain-containing protein [Actinomyces vulturis]